MPHPIDHFLRNANLINGEWIHADSTDTITVTNPADNAQIGLIPRCGKAETRRAIEAANAALIEWRRTSPAKRAQLLRDLHDIILKNQHVLAELLTLEQGKPIAEAMGEVASSAAYVLWFAEEARRVYGDIVPSPWTDRKILVTKEPVGVVAAITPWNFPSSMLARKLAPALAAGCTIVVKPATQTPYSGLAWGVLCEEVGIPKGVVNIITGSASEIGDELCENPAVQKITFTGSTPVGKILLKKAADTVKKVSMELGGNAPFIVFDDADIDRAVEGAINTKFRNSGQTCVCTNRFLVQKGIYEEFVTRFAARVKELKVGNGLDKDTQQGPLIDEKAITKAEAFIADAQAKGGKVLTGGQRHAAGELFFEPTVIANVNPSMSFFKEEIFGPIAPIYQFENEEDAIQIANNTEYGLACYFYTSSLGRSFRVMDALNYGMVGVNEGLITAVEAPFGGVKESGMGKEGGKQGIEEYIETKYVCIGGLGLE
ncbi:succinate-semialdehyde dehydrogenase (NADP(+)) [Paenalcaligenes hominis]|uniref:Succinate-semialdehyde dehydrogenase (NADP(+)) n=1 Tax=Paenalcaligenes hominis TaxID=643674 RepID=A0A1U9JYK3_9BURK|nr:NAD-dependent succinate-semialdehyde dehydrogenase [Paenalcaligenes hominis]AQS50862.1 succinate-semialdehyde dehydrogenase (NADP(+)) [Paenalcaligenes hominis]